MKVLLSPLVSEKSTRIADANNQYAFKVLPDASKPEIRKAVELMFDVKVKGVQVAFQHADVDFRHGWINHLVATNSVHRWHHSADAAEANNNYGAVLVVWDKLFGTFILPPEEDNPAAMGLFDEGRYPIHGIARSIVAPICWKRCVSDPA